MNSTWEALGKNIKLEVPKGDVTTTTMEDRSAKAAKTGGTKDGGDITSAPLEEQKPAKCMLES